MKDLRRLFPRDRSRLRHIQRLTPQHVFRNLNRYYALDGAELITLVRKAAIFAGGSESLEHDMFLSLDTFTWSELAIRHADDELKKVGYFDIHPTELHEIFGDVIGGHLYESSRWYEYHPQLLIWTAEEAEKTVRAIRDMELHSERVSYLLAEAARLRAAASQPA